jgi:hypothetical protein
MRSRGFHLSMRAAVVALLAMYQLAQPAPVAAKEPTLECFICEWVEMCPSQQGGDAMCRNACGPSSYWSSWPSCTESRWDGSTKFYCAE